VKLTDHFDTSELRCHDGSGVPKVYLHNALAVCERAEVLRAALGCPLIVVSGYRSPAYNRRIGGARASQHLTASALDLIARNISAKEMHAAYLRLIKEGKVPDGGVGRYPNFLHIDVGRARRWSKGVETP